MGKINGIPRFLFATGTFQKETFPTPTTFVTSVILQNFGDAIADVMTTLPYWEKNWGRGTFELVVKLHLSNKQYNDYREDYDLLIAELGNMFNKISIQRVSGVIDISVPGAALPSNKSAQAEAFHSAAVGVLLKY